MNYFCILSAGKGKRLGLKNKGLLKIGDITLIEININKCIKNDFIDKIIVVGDQENQSSINKILKKIDSSKLIKDCVLGGEQRQDSSYNILKYLDKIEVNSKDIIFFHNVANIFFSDEDIQKIIYEMKTFDACGVARKSTSTIRIVDENNIAIKVLDRDRLYEMETPQAIKFDIAKKAFDYASYNNKYYTDDISTCESIGVKVKIVETSEINFKITTNKDYNLAKLIYINHE